MSVELGAPCQSPLGAMIQSATGSALSCRRRVKIAILLVVLVDEATFYSEGLYYDDDIRALGQAVHGPAVSLFAGIMVFVLHVSRSGGYDPIFPAGTNPPDWLNVHRVGRPPLVAEYDAILRSSERTAGYISFVVDNSGSMSPGTLAPYLDMYADELRADPDRTDDAVVVRAAPSGTAERWARWLKDSLSEAVDFVRATT